MAIIEEIKSDVQRRIIENKISEEDAVNIQFLLMVIDSQKEQIEKLEAKISNYEWEIHQ